MECVTLESLVRCPCFAVFDSHLYSSFCVCLRNVLDFSPSGAVGQLYFQGRSLSRAMLEFVNGPLPGVYQSLIHPESIRVFATCSH